MHIEPTYLRALACLPKTRYPITRSFYPFLPYDAKKWRRVPGPPGALTRGQRSPLAIIVRSRGGRAWGRGYFIRAHSSNVLVKVCQYSFLGDILAFIFVNLHKHLSRSHSELCRLTTGQQLPFYSRKSSALLGGAGDL